VQDAIQVANMLLRLLASPFVLGSGNPDQNSFRSSPNDPGIPQWLFHKFLQMRLK